MLEIVLAIPALNDLHEVNYFLSLNMLKPLNMLNELYFILILFQIKWSKFWNIKYSLICSLPVSQYLYIASGLEITYLEHWPRWPPCTKIWWSSAISGGPVKQYLVAWGHC